LLQDYQRLQLVELAIGDYKKLKVSKIEFELPRPSYTIHTLAYLREKYPQHDFALIMGADNLVSFSKWKNYELILEDHDIFVYPRPGADGGEFKDHPRVHWTDAPLMEISSTFIRNSIKGKKDVSFMLPEKVWNYIEEMNFYRK